MAIRNGRLLYRDIWDNKPPLLYILYSFFNSDQFWLRLVSVVFGILALIAFYALCKKLFLKDKMGEKSQSFQHQFLVFFCTASRRRKHCKCRKFYALLYYSRRFSNFFRKREIKKNNILALSGFLLGIAFLFKIVGIFDFAAFFVFLFILNLPKKIQSFKKIVYDQLYFSLPFVLGFLFPIVVSALFFSSSRIFHF